MSSRRYDTLGAVRWRLASISSPRHCAWSRFGPLALRRGSFQGADGHWYRCCACAGRACEAGLLCQCRASSGFLGADRQPRSSLVRSAHCTRSRARLPPQTFITPSSCTRRTYNAQRIPTSPSSSPTTLDSERSERQLHACARRFRCRFVLPDRAHAAKCV